MIDSRVVILIIILFMVTTSVSIKNVDGQNPPPTVFIVDPVDNQTVKGVVIIYIVIYDFDQDGISDDIDTDVDNDSRLDNDKDGYEEGWFYEPVYVDFQENVTSSDRDHNNNNIDFDYDPDDDSDGFPRNVDSDDTNINVPWFYEKNPIFPENVTIEIKIDNDRYNKAVDIKRDYINGTWIITYEWDTTKFSNGDHSITVRSIHFLNSSEEDTVNVIVDNLESNNEKSNFLFELMILILIALVTLIWSLIIYIKYQKKKS